MRGLSAGRVTRPTRAPARARYKPGGRSDPMCESERQPPPGDENLHVSPANACARQGATMPIDERSGVCRRWTWQMREGGEVVREGLGQTGAQQQLAHDDVSRSHPLLRQKQYQSSVPLPEVVDASVRIEEDHLLHAERFAPRARSALPPSAASRAPASRARRARRPSSTSAVFVTPGCACWTSAKSDSFTFSVIRTVCIRPY